MKRMTVGELRKSLEGVADEMPVILEVARDDSAEEWNDLVQAYARKSDVEFRCADEEALYLWGDEDQDNDEAVPEPPEVVAQ
jgi:hypothetical protein